MQNILVTGLLEHLPIKQLNYLKWILEADTKETKQWP